jgi:hypothetical protein
MSKYGGRVLLHATETAKGNMQGAGFCWLSPKERKEMVCSIPLHTTEI